MLDLFSSLSIDQTTWVLHGIVFLINLGVLFFSQQFLAIFNQGKDITIQARILRAGAMMFLLLHVIDLLLFSTFPAYQHYFIKIGLTLAAIFGCLILFNISSYFSRQKFGYPKTIDETTVYLDSYNSRLFDILIAVMTIFIGVYCIINIWDWKSLLQTTGLLGIIFGSLALSNGVWFPDVYHGLVMLNSKMLEDGDVIKLVGYEDEQIISRVSFAYTVLLDVRNNHRGLIRNSIMVQNRIDNLSKRASTDGLRHSLSFNIGYPDAVGVDDGELRNSEDRNIRNDGYAMYRARIQDMFDKAFASVSENKDAKINRNMPFEVSLVDSGDYALTFKLHYYLEALPNTKITKTIRQYLIKTPALIQEAVNAAAIREGVVLATPVLVDHKAVG